MADPIDGVRVGLPEADGKAKTIRKPGVNTYIIGDFPDFCKDNCDNWNCITNHKKKGSVKICQHFPKVSAKVAQILLFTNQM